MPTAQKERTIEQAKEWYSKASGLVFTDYRGLKVKEMQQLRQNLKAKGGELHVVKNTLFRRAAGDIADTLPFEFHNGPTAIAFIYQNESDCAKALFDYANTHKTMSVKGGLFGGKIMDAKSVEALSKLPPRDVLIAQLIGTIIAPVSQLVGVVDAILATPIRTIYAVADKLSEGAPAPESKAEAAAPPEAADVESEAQSESQAEAEAPSETTESSESTDSATAESADPAPEAAEPTPEAAEGAEESTN